MCRVGGNEQHALPYTREQSRQAAADPPIRTKASQSDHSLQENSVERKQGRYVPAGRLPDATFTPHEDPAEGLLLEDIVQARVELFQHQGLRLAVTASVLTRHTEFTNNHVSGSPLIYVTFTKQFVRRLNDTLIIWTIMQTSTCSYKRGAYISSTLDEREMYYNSLSTLNLIQNVL